MRIEYENKFSDIVLFNVMHQFLSIRVQVFYLLLIAFIFWSETLSHSVSESVTTAFFWYVAVWIFQAVFTTVYLVSRKNRSVLTRHTVELQEDAFFEETKFNKSFFYWPGVVKAVPRPGFVAVYVTPHSAHIIPNRSFSSKSHRRDFIALVKSKIRAAAA
ncbi:MAG TPA: YcxB family protein [Burkholderiales bacterium]|nr:YcxB family protein [Burkholderiales bacterium]